MVKVIKKNNGFTLVELIISMAILGIVLTSIFSFFNFGNRIFNLGTKKSELQGDTRNAIDYVNRQISNATSLNIMPISNCLSEVGSPTTPSNYEYMYIEGDKLYHYKNTGSVAKVVVENIDAANSGFEKIYENTISFKIKSSIATQNYNTEIRLKLQNFSLMKPVSYIVGLTSGVAIRYTKEEISISPISVASVSISPIGPTSIAADKGELQFTAEVLPYDAKDREVTWTVDYTGLAIPGLAYIDNNGLLKAVKNGSVNVIAKAKDENFQSTPTTVVISNQTP